MAVLGIGIHMTVFLVVPICAFFFVLNRDADKKDFMFLSLFVITELFLILLFSLGGASHVAFYGVSAFLGAGLLIMLYKKIDWAMLIAVGSVATVMLSFDRYFKLLPIAIAALVLLGLISRNKGWTFNWKNGLLMVMVAFLGVSVHAYIPIRSQANPRIDENNPSRGIDGLDFWNWDTTTFISYLDRKQYGQMSMVERMFKRRGALENQLGRHPHMGFYSYFEDQYTRPGLPFIPVLLLGLLGMAVAIMKRWEIGMPFFALFLVCSLGLVLYMNFADGTHFNHQTGDAYLEVRDRDYFFTPAFVFFGIAIGMGVGALAQILRERIGNGNQSTGKTIAYSMAIFLMLPVFALAHNYHASDRSENVIPYHYAKNLLDSCDENGILFTSGDNDTFHLWCLQEVYNYRRDVRVVNLSLLNTDWYVEQMKNRYDVPIALEDDQIIWEPIPESNGIPVRPDKMFADRARRRRTYLVPGQHNGYFVRVQDMIMDEIVIESITSAKGDTWTFSNPIYFTSAPYAESPLRLRDRVQTVGLVYRLMETFPTTPVDTERGYDLFMNTYQFVGFKDASIYRNENATGVYIANGINGVRLCDELLRIGDTTRAIEIADLLIEDYPEYWQTYILLADIYEKRGDSAGATGLFTQLHDTLASFLSTNPENLVYMQDLGLAKVELGNRTDNATMVDDGIDLLWKAFEANPNSNYAFRKLATIMTQERRFTDLRRAAQMFAEYGINLRDPYLQQILGATQAPAPIGQP
jgi:hypothetical protein